jgi:hypothetical protein
MKWCKCVWAVSMRKGVKDNEKSFDDVKKSLYEIKNTSTIKSNLSISSISSIDSCETPFI